MNVEGLTNGLQGLLDRIGAQNRRTLEAETFGPCLEWYDNNLAPLGDQQTAGLELAAKALVAEYSGNDEETSKTCTLLDCVLYLSENGRSELTVVHNLIEEVLDIETIGWCERFWKYMVAREEVLSKDLVGTRSPGLTLIRYCNKLIRRLSKNQHAQFSGTIAMFLARSFPLNEKSGLNLRGNFDTDNVTHYETEFAQDNQEEDGDVPMLNPEDELYDKFWSLQAVFMDPTTLFTKSTMEEFKSKLSTVLSAVHKSDLNLRQNKKEKFGRNTPAPAPQDNEDDDLFTPKWLTRRDLFELQLNDVAFRRTILAQIWILCSFLLGLRQSSKSRWTSIKAVNKSIMFNYTLSNEDEKYFENIMSQIKPKNNSGDLDLAFGRTLTAVVKSDQSWQDWKLKSCPTIEKPKLDTQDAEKVKSQLEQHKQPRKKFWHAMGTAALSRAWKIQTGLDKLEPDAASNNNIPPAKAYYEKSCGMIEQKRRLEELSKEGESEEDVKQQLEELEESLASVTWRGLRAARGQGYWVRFNDVDPRRGFAGLFMSAEEFDRIEEEEKRKQEEKELKEKEQREKELQEQEKLKEQEEGQAQEQKDEGTPGAQAAEIDNENVDADVEQLDESGTKPAVVVSGDDSKDEDQVMTNDTEAAAPAAATEDQQAAPEVVQESPSGAAEPEMARESPSVKRTSDEMTAEGDMEEANDESNAAKRQKLE